MSLPARQPNRDDEFFERMFAHGNQDRSLALIAGGLSAILDHVGELLAEVECLVDHERFARARFLISTADEELGKCHVLLDCARLDVQVHESALKKLSRAFYDHVDKYAYMRLWRFAGSGRFPWWRMDEALKVFNVDRVKFWKATGQAEEPPDEPDMPHDTYFSREMNLYVDLLESGAWWAAPAADPYARHQFESLNGEFELRNQTKSHLDALDTLRKGQAITAQALLVLNSIWAKNYVNRDTPREKLDALWRKTAKAVSGVCSLNEGALLASPLCFWPCYHALQTRPEEL